MKPKVQRLKPKVGAAEWRRRRLAVVRRLLRQSARHMYAADLILGPSIPSLDPKREITSPLHNAMFLIEMSICSTTTVGKKTDKARPD